MKKPTFQQCLRAVGSMTSAQRHESSGGDRAAGQERPGGRGGLPGGNPHRLFPLSPSRGPVVGTCRRTSPVPMPRMQAHLWSLDEYAPCGTSSQGSLDVLSGEICRGGVSPEGGVAVLDQHERGLFVATSIPGLPPIQASLDDIVGKHSLPQYIKIPNAGNMLGAAGRASEPGPKTGRPSRQTRALPGTSAGPGGAGPIGRDR